MRRSYLPVILAAIPLAVFTIGFMVPTISLAATTPVFTVAAPYGVLSSTYTNTTASTINGDVGFTTGPALVPSGTHAFYGSMPPYAAAGADQAAAALFLASQPCTFTFAAGAIDLSTDITHGSPGVYAPGVYCSTGAMNLSGALSLDGLGTYIFRPVGALTSAAGSIVTLNGSSECDVFWTPTQAVTLAANTIFAGTVIDDAGVTVGANTTWTGRALSFGGTVTTDTATITVPTCAATPSPTPFIPSPNVVGPATNFTIMNQPTMPIPENILAAAAARAAAAQAESVQSVVLVSGPTFVSAPTEVYTVVPPNFPETGLPPQVSGGGAFIYFLSRMFNVFFN